MADNKQATGPEEHITPEAAAPDMPGPAPGPDLTAGEAVTLEHEGKAALFEMGEALPDPGDVVVPFEKIDELIKERNAAAREAVEREEEAAPGNNDKTVEAEQPKPRRGRPPKADKAEPAAPEKTAEAAKPRRGRPSQVDKAAPDGAKPPKRDKTSQSKKAAEKPAPAKGEAPAQWPEMPPEPVIPPRPVEEGKIVYLKMSELHSFHTFRDHPYKVLDDAKMTELVGTIKVHGIMTPATVRPEKDGNGYEIIAGHRRRRGGELAGLDEIPCIVRDMTDIEAVREMKISNKQRGDPLPSELAKLLDLEMEAIKHQGARPAGMDEKDAGKRSAEIVGENNGMNYKKVMRYIRLNSLVPELLNMVDDKKMGFMPAVELSFIRPKNQRLIAVSIEGEQATPSLSQAQKLRELDKDNKLNGDVIDGILSQEKKEVDKVIISTAELNNYFGKEATPREMKDQIIALLDEWKSKQPPELAKPEKKADLEK